MAPWERRHKQVCRALLGVLLGSLCWLAAASPVQAAVLFYSDGGKAGWRTSNNPCTEHPERTYCITEVSSPVRSGSRALRFEVRGGETDQGDRYHSEVLTEGGGIRCGDTRWYGFSVYLPAEVRNYDSSYTVHQLKLKSGATFEGAPPVMFLSATPHGVTAEPEAAGKWRIKRYWEDSQGQRQSSYEYLTGAIEYSRWTDFVVKVQLHNDSRGRIQVYKNGSDNKVLDVEGPNCYSSGDLSLDYRFGVYAYDTVKLASGERRISFVDEVRTGTIASSGDWRDSYNAVAPR